MRPEPHFDTTLGALRPPPDIERHDNDEGEPQASFRQGVLGAGLLILTTVGGIVLGCVIAFLAGRAA